jgi:hypothetical protein
VAGVALAAIPIILHLAMKQKPRQLEFPALRFVRLRREANQRRLRVRHMALLLLRVLAISLMALALARPRIQSSVLHVDHEAPVAAAVVFDAAPRMEYRHKNLTRLDQAKETGEWLLDELPRESEIAVLTTRGGPSAFAVDRSAAGQRISRLETSGIVRPLVSVIEEAIRLVGESALERREVYVLTDLSRGAWEAGSAAGVAAALEAAGGVEIYLLDVGVASPRNFYLGDVRLSGQVISKNAPLSVGVELGAVGIEGVRSIELYVTGEDGRFEKRDVIQLDVAAGETRQDEFTLTGLAPGVHGARLQLVGEDALAVDDERYFAVEVERERRVLIVAAPPAQEHAFYLEQALAPQEYKRSGRAQFLCEVVEFSALASIALEAYDAVHVLDPPASMRRDSWNALADYAAAGAGVVVYLGPQASPPEEFQAQAGPDVLAGRLAGVTRGTRHVSGERYDHPLLSRFRALEAPVPWDDLPVYRSWRLEDPAEGALPVLMLSDGGVLLWDRPVGEGHILTMTTPVTGATSEAWNRLPFGVELAPWPFVVLVNEMTAFLCGSMQQQLNYVVGQTAVLRLQKDEVLANVVLLTPRGERHRRTVDLGTRSVAVSTTQDAGLYHVIGATDARRLDKQFAVNLRTDVTDVTRIPEEQLEAILPGVPFRLASEQEDIVRQVSRGRTGQELYPLILLAIVLLIIAEQIVANRFYRPSGNLDEPPHVGAGLADEISQADTVSGAA